ncbi:hypothetical protein EJB05_56573, partial [Eragrostis curvula]
LSNACLCHICVDEFHGLDWDKRYKIIKGISCGLYYLHEECHIVHLDLKPGNILLDETLVPKISDFGISKFVDEKQSHISMKGPLGTPCYMAPEIMVHGEISSSADMYSFGVILIEIIAGCKIIPTCHEKAGYRF